jgi:hypothetical protein
MRAIIGARTRDSFWHPLWDRHYRPHFDHVEIVKLGASYSVSFSYMTQLINQTIDDLSKKCELIVCADTDEILVPDPEKYKDLGDYLDRCEGEVIRCVGYDVLETVGQKSIDINEKVTDTRTEWYRNRLYDKPVIMRKRIMYTPGQHFCNTSNVQDKDLYMLHLRYADLQSLLMRRGNMKFDDYLKEQRGAEPIPEKWRVI